MSVLNDLRQVNQRLESLLARILAEPLSGVTTQEMEGLLSDLLRAAEWTRIGHQPADAEAEIIQYRRHLLQLRDLLPQVQAQLLTERARLELERRHLQAASSWTESVFETV